MIVISAGMPKSGSGWLFNLLNDVMINCNYCDVRIIKENYNLQDVLKNYNCNIGQLTIQNLSILEPAIKDNKSFVIKTHSTPGEGITHMQSITDVKCIFIYRDPRDIALSAFDHGIKQREEEDYNGAFAHIDTIDKAINFALEQKILWMRWNKDDNRYMVSYEQLITNTLSTMKAITQYLGLQIDHHSLNAIIYRYNSKSVKGTHFNKAKKERYLESKDLFEKERSEGIDSFLKEMGYST